MEGVLKNLRQCKLDTCLNIFEKETLYPKAPDFWWRLVLLLLLQVYQQSLDGRGLVIPQGGPKQLTLELHKTQVHIHCHFGFQC